MNKKLNVLFIKDEKSMLDSDSKMFTELFNKVDMAVDDHKALKLVFANEYDIIINDISVNPIDGITFSKQIKQNKPEQNIVTLVSLKDEDKIGGMIEAGIHAFVLSPEQFDQALEAIANMDKKK
jgi:DNA-binding NtrC family response regulator